MPDSLSLSYTLDEQRLRLYVTVRGAYTSRTLLIALFECYRNIENAMTYDRVIDIRRGDGFFSLEDIKSISSALPSQTHTSARVAFISNDPLDRPRLNGLSDMLSVSRYRSFETINEADQWLDQPVSP